MMSRGLRRGAMKRKRCTHSEFKAKVALAAIQGARVRQRMDDFPPLSHAGAPQHIWSLRVEMLRQGLTKIA